MSSRFSFCNQEVDGGFFKAKSVQRSRHAFPDISFPPSLIGLPLIDYDQDRLWYPLPPPLFPTFRPMVIFFSDRHPPGERPLIFPPPFVKNLWPPANFHLTRMRSPFRPALRYPSFVSVPPIQGALRCCGKSPFESVGSKTRSYFLLLFLLCFTSCCYLGRVTFHRDMLLPPTPLTGVATGFSSFRHPGAGPRLCPH